MKPEKILYDEKGRFYIADVGIAKQFKETQKAKINMTITNAGGSMSWMAPEMRDIFENPLDVKKRKTELSKLDVFSLGLIVLFCLDIKEFSNKQLHPKGTLNIVEKDLVDYLNDIKARKIITDDSFFQVLKKMLKFDIKERMNISELNDYLVEN